MHHSTSIRQFIGPLICHSIGPSVTLWISTWISANGIWEESQLSSILVIMQSFHHHDDASLAWWAWFSDKMVRNNSKKIIFCLNSHWNNKQIVITGPWLVHTVLFCLDLDFVMIIIFFSIANTICIKTAKWGILCTLCKHTLLEKNHLMVFSPGR